MPGTYEGGRCQLGDDLEENLAEGSSLMTERKKLICKDVWWTGEKKKIVLHLDQQLTLHKLHKQSTDFR